MGSCPPGGSEALTIASGPVSPSSTAQASTCGQSGCSLCRSLDAVAAASIMAAIACPRVSARPCSHETRQPSADCLAVWPVSVLRIRRPVIVRARIRSPVWPSSAVLPLPAHPSHRTPVPSHRSAPITPQPPHLRQVTHPGTSPASISRPDRRLLAGLARHRVMPGRLHRCVLGLAVFGGVHQCGPGRRRCIASLVARHQAPLAGPGRAPCARPLQRASRKRTFPVRGGCRRAVQDQE